MIKINFSPVRSEDPQLVVSYAAPVITIDGSEYDLSELQDGATAHHKILGAVSREGDSYEVTIKLTHGADAPEGTRFPQSLDVITDGPVTLPVYNRAEVANELA
tara:strand:+ start:435 stop:746 length:312 start_codon:yes stop_codon:yes gene_type:complete